MTISLGYEVGTGKRVTIPVNHTVVLGQTQLSGKTTTMEAMVASSGLRAIGFITKPGEKSFRLQTQIPAFFSESTTEEYWKYVVAILEYRSQTKLGFRERGVIIKLCNEYSKKSSRIGLPDRKGKTKREAVQYGWKAPHSLRGLLENIETWLPNTRGQEEMICIQLREYLRPAIKEIESAEFSDKLQLNPGINVMDVTPLSDGLKSLVIRSVIEWVHKRGRKIVVIIPEAWKFIPEGRTTPVKLALEGLIREGAGVENFVWMDSQDLRGVDKMLLRSVIVWLFGVQRQKNEVASTLASIPDHPKPTATEIMQLGKGQFYVCFGNTLRKTYVQPAGMEDAHAQAIARGEESPDSWGKIVRALDEDNVAVAKKDSSPCPKGIGDELDGDVPGRVREIGEADGESSAFGSGTRSFAESAAPPDDNNSQDAGEIRLGDEEKMWKEKYEELAVEHQTLIEAHDALATRVQQLENRSPSGAFAARGTVADEGGEAPGLASSGASIAEAGAAHSSEGRAAPTSNSGSEMREELYRYIVGRAQKDPRVLSVLASRPELQVTIERQSVEVGGNSLRGHLARLIATKYFDTPKNGNTAFNELKRRGVPVAKPNVYRELDKLAEMGFVTCEENGYQAVSGMKIHIIEMKEGKAVAAR